MNKRYLMDYIEDKELFKAVMFARNMIRDGLHPAIANSRAAKYYGFSVTDVAQYVGQTAGNVNAKRNKK